MIDVKRLCIKLAGRDAGKKCVVVDVLDKKFVMIDGLTRRRRCNIAHIEPLKETLNIKKGASHDEVKAAFKKIGIEIVDKKSKKQTTRPKRIRKTKENIQETVKEKKKAEKVQQKKEKTETKPVVQGEKKEPVKIEEKTETQKQKTGASNPKKEKTEEKSAKEVKPVKKSENNPLKKTSDKKD